MLTKQADERFLHGVLLLLILAALASGVMAISMVQAHDTPVNIVSQP